MVGWRCSNKEWNYVACSKMDGTGSHYIKGDKPSSQRQMSHVFSHMWNSDLKKVSNMEQL
jgi:hypothetical protein